MTENAGANAPNGAPRVNRERIRPLLATLDADSALGREFLIRGSPGNPIRKMTGDHNDSGIMVRTAEIANCITHSSAWGFEFRSIADVVYRGVYHLFKDGWDPDRVTDFLEEALELKLTEFMVAWGVEGLKIGGDAVHLGDFLYGPLSKVLENLGIPLDDVPEEWKHLVVVCYEIEVPDARHIMDYAYPLAQRGLGLLATVELRGMFDHGSSTSMRLSRDVLYATRDGKDVEARYMNPWLDGHPFEIARESLACGARPYRKAPPDPWTDLPDGGLRGRIQRSYEIMGQAVLMQRCGEASRALALAALEIAYGPSNRRHGKKATALARRLKLAVAMEGGISDPNEFLAAFDHRDEVLHEGVPVPWRRKDAKRHLSQVYTHLDQLASYCIEHDFVDESQLWQALDNADVVENARKWAERFQGWHKTALNHAYYAETRSSYSDGIKRWSDVMKAIGRSNKHKSTRAQE